MAQRVGRKGTGKADGSVRADHFGGTARILQSRFHARMRAATLSPKAMLRSVFLLGLGFLFLVFIALWLGGHLSTVRQEVSDYKRDRLMAMGFTVERIDVMGEGRLDEADVRAAVGIYEGDYFFATDLKRAQERTESLPWVDRAVVRRLWPNRIVVQLVETTPYALNQEEGQIFLIGRDGARIATLSDQTSRLPDGLKLFTGPDAAQHASEISGQLEPVQSLWAMTESLTRQPSGRWDAHLKTGAILRLPLGGERKAAFQFWHLHEKSGLAHTHSIIDMRLPDRLTLTSREDQQA